MTDGLVGRSSIDVFGVLELGDPFEIAREHADREEECVLVAV